MGGLPGAGAKSLSARIARDSFPSESAEEVSTQEWQTVCRTFEDLDLHLLALGSQTSLWSQQLSCADVLAFVVDASQEVDVPLLGKSFARAVLESGLRAGAPVVVFFNKVDAIEDAVAEERKGIAAAALACGAVRQCRVCSVSAKTGDGVDEATRVLCGNTLTF